MVCVLSVMSSCVAMGVGGELVCQGVVLPGESSLGKGGGRSWVLIRGTGYDNSVWYEEGTPGEEKGQ